MLSACLVKTEEEEEDSRPLFIFVFVFVCFICCIDWRLAFEMAPLRSDWEEGARETEEPLLDLGLDLDRLFREPVKPWLSLLPLF